MNKCRTSAYLLGLTVLAVAAMIGCEGDQGPAGPPGEVANLNCAQCHNDTNVITGKQTQWSESLHGTGEAFVRGTRSSCAGCHSGNAFAAMIEAGLDPGAVAEGDPDPTRQDCRTCHQIHDTFTMADWALRTTDAVALYAVEGSTYDGGTGNLCVNCHQPRRVIPAAVDGVVSGISSHWGPHHGPQSSMLMGVAGAGAVTGNASAHYTLVGNTCVACHMGEGDNHTFEPDTDNCQQCHSGAEDFDINGLQTEVQSLIDQLGAKLLAAGLIDVNAEEGHPIVSSAPEAQAIALWNWIYIAHEDKSLGVHNPAYTKALLEASLALMP